MWQQLERRIDEVFEALHAFRRVNIDLDEERQAYRLSVELSRRKLRGEEGDEFHAFVQWVGPSQSWNYARMKSSCGRKGLFSNS
ncbi:hypothetical protein B0H19DRAFT_677501 [Mycena capillaripes]|nr:hypothetical protein B0H19DRAFT_677501 [Mycena capillaripes]